MQLGPLFIGWTPLSEADRIAFGLDAWAPGWEVFSVEWNGIGFTFCARPKEARNGN